MSGSEHRLGAYQHRVRVYYEDTDAAGVVYHTSYLRYMDRARTEWLRSQGWSVARLATELGLLFVVGEVKVRYRIPAHHDDELDVGVRVESMRPASLTVDQPVVRVGGTVICEGSIRLVAVGTDSFRPKPIPVTLLRALDP
ncbi:MAG: tol-pal system-associated acyl-CoA thioesterase [Gammaproteobacteria bacterium]